LARDVNADGIAEATSGDPWAPVVLAWGIPAPGTSTGSAYDASNVVVVIPVAYRY
jgi:hypothetical protein